MTRTDQLDRLLHDLDLADLNALPHRDLKRLSQRLMYWSALSQNILRCHPPAAILSRPHRSIP